MVFGETGHWRRLVQISRPPLCRRVAIQQEKGQRVPVGGQVSMDLLSWKAPGTPWPSSFSGGSWKGF